MFTDVGTNGVNLQQDTQPQPNQQLQIQQGVAETRVAPENFRVSPSFGIDASRDTIPITQGVSEGAINNSMVMDGGSVSNMDGAIASVVPQLISSQEAFSINPTTTSNGLDDSNDEYLIGAISSATNQDGESDDKADYSGFPGRIEMMVPPRTVPTPMVAIGSIMELEWKYDKSLTVPPKHITIALQLPKLALGNLNTPALVYEIATNITGETTSYSWNTGLQAPSGMSYKGGIGNQLFIFDSDLGLKKSDLPPTGRLLKLSLPLTFYNSRYNQTNDGVPRNYNPNHAATTLPSIFMPLSAAFLSWLLCFTI